MTRARSTCKSSAHISSRTVAGSGPWSLSLAPTRPTRRLLPRAEEQQHAAAGPPLGKRARNRLAVEADILRVAREHLATDGRRRPQPPGGRARPGHGLLGHLPLRRQPRRAADPPHRRLVLVPRRRRARGPRHRRAARTSRRGGTPSGGPCAPGRSTGRTTSPSSTARRSRTTKHRRNAPRRPARPCSPSS